MSHEVITLELLKLLIRTREYTEDSVDLETIAKEVKYLRDTLFSLDTQQDPYWKTY